MNDAELRDFIKDGLSDEELEILMDEAREMED